MFDNESCCVSGPPDDYPSLNGSLGKFMFDALKRRGAADIVNDSIRAAGVLKHLGIQSGDIIAIISENSVTYCVPVLAAFYEGATVNPLNPAYSIGELKHILGISMPKLILCSESVLENLLKVKEELEFAPTIILMGPRSENYSEIISFDDLLKEITPDVDNYEHATFDCSEQGAFIFTSSGTTGLPKSVLLTHRNWRVPMGYLHNLKYGGITTEERIIFVLPLFHVFGQAINLASIAFSKTQIMMEIFEPNVFLETVQKHKITKIFGPPPLLLFLARSPLADNFDMTSLRDIIIGGAPLGKELQDAAAKRFTGVTIRQGLAATETSASCTFQMHGRVKPGSVGCLIPGVTAMVWDGDSKKKLGPLENGELCFKASMIMKGYVNNTAATEECIDKEEFYHTGDFGNYDHEGNFYHLDRLKELIKYKGFQVPPAELEALILTHPGVKDCGVIGIPDERAGQVPLAYVVRQSASNVTEENVVEYVASRISAQKHLYGGVIFIDDIPKSASGKFLRRKLVDIFKATIHQNQ